MKTYTPLGPQPEGIKDVRLRRRVADLIERFVARPERTIAQAAGGRNARDAAYHVFANSGRVRPEAIIADGLDEVRKNLGDAPRVLAVQDGTELNFSGRKAAGLGHTSDARTLGLLVHSTLPLDVEGLPPGLVTQQIWTRDPATRGDKSKRRAPTRRRASAGATTPRRPGPRCPRARPSSTSPTARGTSTTGSPPIGPRRPIC